MNRITDIFGQHIEDSVNHAVIFIKPSRHLIRPVKVERSADLWRADPIRLRQLLKKHGLNPQLYLLLGDQLQPDQKIPMVLIHPEVSQVAADYLKVGRYGEGFLWKPIYDSDTTNLGLIYGTQKPDPQECRIGVVNLDLLRISINKLSKISPLNEFKLVGYREPMKTFDRMAFISDLDHDRISKEAQQLLQSRNAPGPRHLGSSRSSAHSAILSSYGSEMDSRYSSGSQSSSDSTEIQDAHSWLNPQGRRVVLMVPDDPWYVTRKRLLEQEKIKNQPPPATLPSPLPQPKTAPIFPQQIPQPYPVTSDPYSLEQITEIKSVREKISPSEIRRIGWNIAVLTLGLVTLVLAWQVWRMFYSRR